MWRPPHHSYRPCCVTSFLKPDSWAKSSGGLQTEGPRVCNLPDVVRQQSSLLTRLPLQGWNWQNIFKRFCKWRSWLAGQDMMEVEYAPFILSSDHGRCWNTHPGPAASPLHTIHTCAQSEKRLWGSPRKCLCKHVDIKAQIRSKNIRSGVCCEKEHWTSQFWVRSESHPVYTLVQLQQWSLDTSDFKPRKASDLWFPLISSTHHADRVLCPAVPPASRQRIITPSQHVSS